MRKSQPPREKSDSRRAWKTAMSAKIFGTPSSSRPPMMGQVLFSQTTRAYSPTSPSEFPMYLTGAVAWISRTLVTIALVIGAIITTAQGRPLSQFGGEGLLWIPTMYVIWLHDQYKAKEEEKQ